MMRRILLTIAASLCLASAQAVGGEGFVEANGIKFHYVEEGKGAPLLLIHGGSVTLDMWRALIPRASAKFHVYAYDTRGHGATENPSGQLSYELLEKDCAALIEALHLDHPLVLGYSDGGTTALLLSIEHPDVPRAVIVGGATDRVAGDPHYFAGLKAFFGTDKAGQLTDAQLDALAASQPETAAFYEQVQHRDGNPGYWRVLLKELWPMWTTPLTVTADRLRAVKAPMLVLLADGDDFSRPEDAVSLQEDVTGGELAILPGARHSVFRDRPELFNLVVLDFFERHMN
jgi:pimeloyl-ACP methyl ester carboxylesterase